MTNLLYLFPTYNSSSKGISEKNRIRVKGLSNFFNVKGVFLTKNKTYDKLTNDIYVHQFEEIKFITKIMRVPIFWRFSASIFSSFNMCYNLIKCFQKYQLFNSEVVYLRYQGSSFWFFCFLKYLKSRGVYKVFIEFNSIREIDIAVQKGNLLKTRCEVFLEKIWLSLCVKLFELVSNSEDIIEFYKKKGVKKYHYWGNGIEFRNLKYETKKKPPLAEINLLFVSGTVNPMHGIDRYLKSFNQYNGQYSINVKWVGKLDCKVALENFIHEKISFEIIDLIENNELKSLYEWAHLGLGSIAFYKQNLHVTSDLKSKEYLAYGLPTVIGFEDPDLKGEIESFIYKIPNNSNNFSVNSLVDWVVEVYKVKNVNNKIHNLAKETFEYNKLTMSFITSVNA